MGGGGSTYDYGFRIYNPQIAKFLSVDPLTSSYPWYTPYQFAGNKPIIAEDLDGLEERIVIWDYEDQSILEVIPWSELQPGAKFGPLKHGSLYMYKNDNGEIVSSHHHETIGDELDNYATTKGYETFFGLLKGIVMNEAGLQVYGSGTVGGHSPGRSVDYTKVLGAIDLKAFQEEMGIITQGAKSKGENAIGVGKTAAQMKILETAPSIVEQKYKGDKIWYTYSDLVEHNKSISDPANSEHGSIVYKHVFHLSPDREDLEYDYTQPYRVDTTGCSISGEVQLIEEPGMHEKRFDVNVINIPSLLE